MRGPGRKGVGLWGARRAPGVAGSRDPALSTWVNGTPLFIADANCCDCLRLKMSGLESRVHALPLP